MGGTNQIFTGAPCTVQDIQHRLTTLGQTGYTGPTSNSGYSSELRALVSVSSGIQTFTVPITGRWSITAVGAQGGCGYNGDSRSNNVRGGYGAKSNDRVSTIK